MKQHLFSLILALCSLLFSCKKSELLNYQSANVLYFEGNIRDTLHIDFSKLMDNVKDSVLKIPVHLIGKHFDVATPYQINYMNNGSTATEGVDFSLISKLIFPERKSQDTLLVKLYRTPHLQSDTMLLTLELATNPTFQNQFIDNDRETEMKTKMSILISDVLGLPVGWKNTDEEFGLEHYLGRFTKKKFLLCIELDNLWDFETTFDYMYQFPLYYGDLLADYLKSQSDAGTPVLEDDGTPMTVGPYYTN